MGEWGATPVSHRWRQCGVARECRDAAAGCRERTGGGRAASGNALVRRSPGRGEGGNGGGRRKGGQRGWLGRAATFGRTGGREDRAQQRGGSAAAAPPVGSSVGTRRHPHCRRPSRPRMSPRRRRQSTPRGHHAPTTQTTPVNAVPRRVPPPAPPSSSRVPSRGCCAAPPPRPPPPTRGLSNTHARDGGVGDSPPPAAAAATAASPEAGGDRKPHARPLIGANTPDDAAGVSRQRTALCCWRPRGAPPTTCRRTGGHVVHTRGKTGWVAAEEGTPAAPPPHPHDRGRVEADRRWRTRAWRRSLPCLPSVAPTALSA